MDDQLNRLKQSQQSRREMLAQWRASRLHELPLPSGMTVWVKDVSMMDLMLMGNLPPSLLEFAEEANNQGKAEIDLKKVAQSGPEFKSLLDTVVLTCVVEPPIAQLADDDHLGLDEINGDDKMHIFNWLNREVSDLKPFREGEVEPVALVQPGNRLRAESQ
jgi:hypothetical protein